MAQRVTHPPAPPFEVRLTVPDIAPWLEGNTGVRGFTTRAASTPGPHVALLGLTHGNEISGAIVLDRLLRAGLQPTRGRLTFGFVNPEAFQRFDPRQPTASRFVDEDINRVWDIDVLDGPRHSVELERAREIRPLIDTVDVLIDLHSMLWPSEPLTLCGETEKGRRLALETGVPAMVVADHGHAGGKRIIDYPRFADPESPYVGNLIEAGQHWEPATVDIAREAVGALLHHLEMAPVCAELPPPLPRPRARFARVTKVVTATTANFSFVQDYRGGDVVAKRNTVIALDGATEIRTPHNDCVLVMPSLRPSRGHTAVRLGKFE
jgi:Succinylglutamate desuccinylase / Aspartoacylase family